MNNQDNNISNFNKNPRPQVTTEIVFANDSVVAVKPIENDLQVHHINDSDKKEKENTLPTKEETNIRLLGSPLVECGPYSFYSAFAYRHLHGNVEQKSQKCKRGIDENLYSDHADSSSALVCSEWSVVHMNHFYAVRPWYNKQNSSDQQKLLHQKRSSKFTSTVIDQQSVCIAELELLWRDDEISTSNIISSSSFKKCGKNRMVPTSLTISNEDDYRNDIITSSNLNHSIVSSNNDDDDNDDDYNDDDGRKNCGNYNSNSIKKLLLLPQLRTLPRRKRQPSAKKLEAAKSFAATVASNQFLQHSLYRHNQLSSMMSLDSTSAPSVPYKHSNILCSVRLYVMPDQTATGRLGSVHGEDEVLEINTLDNIEIENSSPNNTFINGISSSYNSRIDNFDNNRNHSSKSLPTSCSGLILRVEDFVEWVRCGLMNNENENEGTDLRNHESKIEQFKEENVQQLNLSPLTSNVKSEVNRLQKLETYFDDKNKIKLESTITVNVKMEQKNCNSEKDKTEKHKNNSYSKSIVEEAVKIKEVSLAAALINGIHDRCNHCLFNLVNRNISTTKQNYFGYKLKDNCIKQQLVILSYSQYCRYKANLQRRRYDPLNEGDNSNTTRVLFCRDTYDYPAELLLDPFNTQNLTQKNTAVLVNHMAPKLKGWPAHPASWMSFRWNRLHHLKYKNNDNNERRRRHRCQKLKKKCQRQNLAGGALAIMSCSSSSLDDHSDSDGISSATNDAVTTTITTSDSDNTRPSVITKITNKNYSVDKINVIDGVNHNIKKTISVVPESNVIVINGANLSKNKRLPLIEQPSQQQPTKRRRVVYSAKSQHSQQKMNTFATQLSTPPVRFPMTKMINLPPSISIRPVIVTNNNTSVQRKQTTIVNSQCKNNNSEQKFRYDDNGYFKESPIANFMAADSRAGYHDFEEGYKQQQSQKQHQWLIDTLRLDGLEVTAIPLNISESNKNFDAGSTNLEQQQKKLCEDSFESLLSTKNEQNDGNGSHLNKNSDSVLMTVTPDVVCILNKSQQPQQIQRSHYQQMSSGDVPNFERVSQQSQHIKNKNPALHEKINQAINSLKRQKSNTLINNRNVIVMDRRNYQNINDNSRRHKNEGIWQPSTLLDLTVKSSSNTTRQQRCIINKNVQEHGQIVPPFHSIPTMRSPATNLEITIVPVPTSTTGNSTNNAIKNGIQQQQKFGLHNNFTGSLQSPCTVFSSSSIEHQNTVPPLISKMFYSDKNKQNRQSNRPAVSLSTTINSSQQQVLIMTTSSAMATTNNQKNH